MHGLKDADTMCGPSTAEPPWSDFAILGKSSGFRHTLMRRLREDGHHSMAFASGSDLLQSLRTCGPMRLIVIDWRDPDPDCLDLLDALRKIEPDTTVVLITSLNGAGPSEGANLDFDATRLISLLRRVSSLQRCAKGEGADAPALDRSNGRHNAAALQSLGPVTLDESTQRAYWNQTMVRLTTTEYAIVELLVSRAGTDIAYRELYDIVHGKDFAAGHGSKGYRANVRSMVKRIRQKFRKIDPEFHAICNYSGFGYRWHIGTEDVGRAS